MPGSSALGCALGVSRPAFPRGNWLICNPAQEADALNCLGDLLLRTGEHGQAGARYSAAILLAAQAGAAAEQARAQDGLARARLAAAHVGDQDGNGPP